MSSPYTASGNNGISVADAKAYLATIDAGAISDQVAHYTSVAGSLNTLAQAITIINNNLQATWSGTAADAANVQFTTAATNASTMASLLSDSVVPALNDAHQGAQKAQAAIKNVKDEVTQVPGTATGRAAGLNGNPSQNIPPAVNSQMGTPPDIPNNSMTADQAVAFNAQQRTAAASAMNAVASPYSASASTLTTVANQTAMDSSNTSTSSSTTGFNLTAGSGAPGSNGAANNYQSTIGSGSSGGTGVGSSGGSTKVQGFVPPSPPPPVTVPPSPLTSVSPPPPPVILPVSPPVLSSPPVGDPPVGDPPVGTIPGGGAPVGGDPGGVDPVTGLPVGGGGSGTGSDPALGVFGEGGLPGGGSGVVSGATGFGEGGLASGNGSGIVPGRTGFGDPAPGGMDTGVIGTNAVSTGSGQGSDQSGVGMMGGAMPGGGAGGSGSGAGGSGPSASYLRGRYLGDEESSGSVPPTWQNPAIGGSESVLIGGQPAEGSTVTSVYAGAQDGQGNPVGMMGGGLGGGRGYGDESEDSGSRPGYLKEDPQWWTPQGSYVPPVVE